MISPRHISVHFFSSFSQANSTKVLSGLQLRNVVQRTKPVDIACVLLPLCSLILWSLSLRFVNIAHMNDLGMISVLPPSILIALLILIISFCVALRQPQMRTPVLLLHLVLLVFMLYGLTTLVEAEPSYSWVYRHAGYTEYIMRTGSVDPTLDTYFNWPGFFVLNALVTQVAGYHTPLSYAAWAPVFFNLIYLGPLSMILTSATSDKRLMWLGLWFFALTNWIEQDTFAPQALNIFLYLVIIAILLKWFKVPAARRLLIRVPRWQHLGRFSSLVQGFSTWLTAPDMLHTSSSPWRRRALLVILVVVFSLVVFSHPLTPFALIGGVTALVIFRRCSLWWLPILMVIMTGAWIFFMTQAFLVGHMGMVTGDFGHVGGAITTNVTSRVTQGNPEHTFIADMRVLMTVFIWGLACLGAIRRLRRGYHDLTYILLAVVPFSLIVAQSYGGELILRIYIFSLPFMVLFAAALFYINAPSGRSRWMMVAITITSIVLLSGFLFARYGNERIDYVTKAEFDGVHYLYSVAPPHSLFIEGWNDTPWLYQDYEKYTLVSLGDVLPDVVFDQHANAIVQYIQSQPQSNVYVIFTRAQRAQMQELYGLPSGTLDRLEHTLLSSGKFRLLYSNPDAQILQYQPPSTS